MYLDHVLFTHLCLNQWRFLFSTVPPEEKGGQGNEEKREDIAHHPGQRGDGQGFYRRRRERRASVRIVSKQDEVGLRSITRQPQLNTTISPNRKYCGLPRPKSNTTQQCTAAARAISRGETANAFHEPGRSIGCHLRQAIRSAIVAHPTPVSKKKRMVHTSPGTGGSRATIASTAPWYTIITVPMTNRTSSEINPTPCRQEGEIQVHRDQDIEVQYKIMRVLYKTNQARLQQP